MEDLTNKLATLIVEVLNLRITPESIDPETALFNSGLGLDSIDALEIVVAVQMEYGVKIRANDDESVKILSSLRSLAEYIAAQKRTV
ncbi:MAG: phosphopantetheine-binding protein [Candidatus Thiodiazotropha sp. (ex. Lucinoma kazani)]